MGAVGAVGADHISVLSFIVSLQQTSPECDIQPAGWRFAAARVGIRD